jgi:uncharacterized protein YdeI (YjbR/CyaY-like superfamily)
VAAVVPDARRIRSFADVDSLEIWMRENHDQAPELWLKVHKKGSGRKSVDCAAALEVMLCWGWIDGLRKGFDQQSFLQRYTPRRAKSIWSQVNREHVARLIAAGRMTEHGQKQIDAAKADGRWDRAYAPIRKASADGLPPDLLRAIRKNPKALRTFKGLSRQNLFALGFRTNHMKTPEGRKRKIASLVAMLARGETIVPQKTKAKPAAKPAAKPKKA